MERLTFVGPEDLTLAEQPATPGMDRYQALAGERFWSGIVRTAPGQVSGWHHHGEYETFAYMISGSIRFEFGPGGTETVGGGAGGFAYVPRGVVHRESNPGDEESVIVVVRIGHGPPVVNVEGPEQG